jgi:hypothetical protein
MFANIAKDSSQVDQFGPVQMQGIDGRPADGAAAQD